MRYMNKYQEWLEGDAFDEATKEELRGIKEDISYIIKYDPWEILSIPRVIFFL